MSASTSVSDGLNNGIVMSNASIWQHQASLSRGIRGEGTRWSSVEGSVAQTLSGGRSQERFKQERVQSLRWPIFKERTRGTDDLQCQMQLADYVDTIRNQLMWMFYYSVSVSLMHGWLEVAYCSQSLKHTLLRKYWRYYFPIHQRSMLSFNVTDNYKPFQIHFWSMVNEEFSRVWIQLLLTECPKLGLL